LYSSRRKLEGWKNKVNIQWQHKAEFVAIIVLYPSVSLIMLHIELSMTMYNTSSTSHEDFSAPESMHRPER